MEKLTFSVVLYSTNENYLPTYHNLQNAAHWVSVRKNKKKKKKNRRTPNDELLPVNFEIIFTGNNPPKETMLGNCYYIESDATLSGSLNMAVKKANSDYVILTSDTVTHSQFYLSWLSMFHSRLAPRDILIFPRYSVEGNIRDDLMRFDPSIDVSPLAGRDFLFKKDTWIGLGGLDKKFKSISASSIDMQMRFYEIGYTPFIVAPAISNESSYNIDSDDRKLLNSLWVNPDGTMSKTRLSPVE